MKGAKSEKGNCKKKLKTNISKERSERENKKLQGKKKKKKIVVIDSLIC